MSVLRPTKVISGGQTGADLGGLRAGKALGIPTGGMMPRDFRNDLGSRGWMREQFGMTEHPSRQYKPRTLANIRWADCTFIFGSVREPGSRLTLNACWREQRTVFVNPQVDMLLEFISEHLGTVNIAGNRERGNRGIEAYVYRLLIEAWAPDAATYARLVPSAPWPDPLPRLTNEDGDPVEAPHVLERPLRFAVV